MSVIKNKHFDSYLLSESSLFVYKERVIIKTCGTTKLLTCLPTLIQNAYNVFKGEFELNYVLYTHRDFKFPEKQHFGGNWEEEKSYLYQIFPKGKDFLVGEANGDQFHVFCQDDRDENSVVPKYSTLEIAMNELCREKMENHFYKNSNFSSEETTVKESGISTLLPTIDNDEKKVDSLMFDPFGFSLNAMNGGNYYTMHITPQSECSYVSYETNEENQIRKTIADRVVELFKPGKFTVALVHSKNVVSPFEGMKGYESMEISKHLVLKFYSSNKK